MFYRIGYVLSDYSQGQKTQGTIREASTLKSMESDLQLQDLPPGSSNGGAVMALLMLNRIVLRFMESRASKKINGG
jgi:hypothetical protein